MKSRWNDAQAHAAALGCAHPDLGVRVYTSRLLGSEHALVLHGGGNTSVKSTLINVFGEREDVLWVKGSGSDLAQVQAQDFAAIRLHGARRLIELDALDAQDMAAALTTLQAAPGPRASIETILHAILPARFVEHTHADVILALGNTANGPARIRKVFGDLAPLVPFRSSGFDLAKACHATFQAQASARTIGLVLHHHGVVAFGDSARASYENMLRLVTLAEDYLQRNAAWTLPVAAAQAAPGRARTAALRGAIAHCAGFPLLLEQQRDEVVCAFAGHPALPALSAAGPATPQHAVFIKREPMLGTDVQGYARRYTEQVAALHPDTDLAALGLDAAPRAVIDTSGVWVAAINTHHLRLTREILRQDVEIKSRASAHDRYVGLPLAELLHAEIHYGGFERRLRAKGLPLLGESAVVLGARGAATGSEPARDGVANLAAALECGGAAVSVIGADEDLESALDRVVQRFGGVDVAIVALDATPPQALLALLALAPRGGRLVQLGAHAQTAAVDESIATAWVDAEPLRLSPAQAQLVAALCTPAVAASHPHLTLATRD